MAILLIVACSFQPTYARDTGQDDHEKPTTLETLVEALEQRGAVVERSGDVDQPFFSPTGIMISIDGETIQVFEYESAQARRNESESISPSGTTIGTHSMHWIGTPRFWASGRILVLYLGTDEAIIETLSTLLGSAIAGPEQSANGSPRAAYRGSPGSPERLILLPDRHRSAARSPQNGTVSSG